jgi:CheY-like chemotaxis protein
VCRFFPYGIGIGDVSVTKILVVDDSSFQRRNISRALAEDGYDLVEASGGEEALELVELEKPDCVLTDLIMPGMDGFDLLARVREKPSAPPVIVVTADIQEGTRQQCIQMGARAFVNKPVMGDDVRQAVKQVLGLSRASE